MKEMKKMGNPKVLKCKCGGYPDFINVGDHRNLYICRCNRCGAELSDLGMARSTPHAALKVWNAALMPIDHDIRQEEIMREIEKLTKKIVSLKGARK